MYIADVDVYKRQDSIRPDDPRPPYDIQELPFSQEEWTPIYLWSLPVSYTHLDVYKRQVVLYQLSYCRLLCLKREEEETRNPTSQLTLPPQSSASTNSATSPTRPITSE